MAPPLEDALREFRAGCANLGAGATGKLELRAHDIAAAGALFEVRLDRALLQRCSTRHGRVDVDQLVAALWRAERGADAPLPRGLARDDGPGWRTRREEEPSFEEAAQDEGFCAWALAQEMAGPVLARFQSFLRDRAIQDEYYEEDVQEEAYEEEYYEEDVEDRNVG